MTDLKQYIPEPLKVILKEIRYVFRDFYYSAYPYPLNKVLAHSLVSPINLLFLQELCRRLNERQIQGDFVECGVYRGSSAGVLAHSIKESGFKRKLWLYDAFKGMPKAGNKDDEIAHFIFGKYIGSERQVYRTMRKLKVSSNIFTVIPGWFDDTFPKAEYRPVALLHVDCDFYDPVKKVIDTFYEWVVPGGYIVFNDYGTFQGCKIAVDEFIVSKGLKLVQIDEHAYFIQK